MSHNQTNQSAIKNIIACVLCAIALIWATAAQAQETPRPTPTNMPASTSTPAPTTASATATATTGSGTTATATATSESNTSSADSSASNGSIRGMVYADTNGDGECVDTGRAGEEAIVNIPIEFVTSDGRTSLYLASGDDGSYGLVAAGYGVWTVSARPNADQWVITSDSTQEVTISSETPVVTGVNFCLRSLVSSSGSTLILPDSGAPAQSNTSLWVLAAVLGFAFLGAGTWLRNRPSQ